MKKIFLAIFLTGSFGIGQLNAQSNISDQTSGLHWSIFWNGSLDLSSERFNANKFSFQGLGTKLNYTFNNGVGVGAKLSYRYWNDLDRTVVPLFVGANHMFLSNDIIELVLVFGFGPELIIGNDYASIFLGYEVGPEIRLKLKNGHALLMGIAFAQGMAGHPDHFEYLDFTIGYQF